VAFYTYTVTHYSVPSGTTTVLNNVSSFSSRGGRQNLLDPVTVSTAQINGFNPSALPTIKVGDLVVVTSSPVGGGPGGFVSNFQVYYGQDPDEDRLTISLEDAAAFMGRATINISWSAGVTTRSAALDVASAAGVDFSGSITDTSKSTVSAGSSYVATPGVRTCEPCSNVHMLRPRLAQSANSKFKDRRAVFRS